MIARAVWYSSLVRLGLRARWLLGGLVTLLGCGSGDGVGAPQGTTGVGGDATTTTTTSASAAMSSGSEGSGGAPFTGPIGGDRPVEIEVPPSYDPAKPTPLVLLLHGYVAGSGLQEIYLGLGSEAAARGYLFVQPFGTTDKTGLPFWNATDACCNFYGSKVDDVGYLATVLAELQAVFNVDPKRIYLVGHSNGGFMAHRMACEHAETIAAIATLAGSTYADPVKCTPSEPVSALVMHGTLDPVILYGGGNLFGKAYPGADETARAWAKLDGCSPTANESLPRLDLVGTPLDETKVSRWSGCAGGIEVEQWRIEGATHVPLFTSSFKQALFDFLDAHPKP